MRGDLRVFSRLQGKYPLSMLELAVDFSSIRPAEGTEKLHRSLLLRLE